MSRRKIVQPPRRIIRRAERKRRTSLSDAQTWRLEQAGKHPVRVLLNPEAGPQGGVGWYEDEIDQWVGERIRAAGRRPLISQRPAEPPAPLADPGT